MKLLFISIMLFIFQPIMAQMDDSNLMSVFIVIADTSDNYSELRTKMFHLSSKLNIPIDTMERTFDTNEKRICLPYDHKDELYAGSYFHRRFPSNSLSIEHLDFYIGDKKFKKINMALFVNVSDNRKDANIILEKVKQYYKDSFLIETKFHMGCMH